jgi:hypothetical protein
MKNRLAGVLLFLLFFVGLTGVGFAQQTVTQQFTLTVTVPTLSISTTSLPYGISTVAYSQTVNATGGIAPYTWSVSAGNLPAGLSLNTSTGVISGTPTTIGANSFTIKVTDSQSTPATATQAFNVPIVGKLLITTTTLPGAIVGQPYTGVVNFTGGVAPYVCTVSTGTLPSWATLAVSGNTCTITGTPTAPISDTFTIQVGSAQ